MKALKFERTLRTGQTPPEAHQDIIKIRNWWTGYYDEEFTNDTERLLKRSTSFWLGITIVP